MFNVKSVISKRSVSNTTMIFVHLQSFRQEMPQAEVRDAVRVLTAD